MRTSRRPRRDQRAMETFDEEQIEEPRMRNFYHACHHILYAFKRSICKYPHGMTKEDIQIIANEQVNQRHHDYIETLVPYNHQLKHHFILQQFLAPSQSKQLVPHILVSLKAYFSNLNMSIFVIMLCTWLHWKYSYT
jgi:hypothetical protein